MVLLEAELPLGDMLWHPDNIVHSGPNNQDLGWGKSEAELEASSTE